jgi:hypothetical protein
MYTHHQKSVIVDAECNKQPDGRRKLVAFVGKTTGCRPPPPHPPPLHEEIAPLPPYWERLAKLPNQIKEGPDLSTEQTLLLKQYGWIRIDI